MPAAFPCGICLNPVAKNHKAVKCDNCDLWIHIKCNKINVQTSDLQNSSQYLEVDNFNKPFNSSNHKVTNFFHMNIFEHTPTEASYGGSLLY